MALGRVLYGAFFCAVLPLLLAGLAWCTRGWVALPLPEPLGRFALLDWALFAGGALLMLKGMFDLSARGGGLPMNAFPPPRLVTEGVYGWVGQPIYIGAVMMSAGLSAAMGSTSGFWLVTPILALGAAALTFGHERRDLLRRHGAVSEPIVGLPRSGMTPATWGQRAGTMTFVLVPWLLLFWATSALPPPPDGVSAYLQFELAWPVIPWTELIYASAYLAVPWAFLRDRSRDSLRRFAVGGLLGTALVGLLWWTVPLVAPPRPIGGLEPSFWTRALAWERSVDDPVGLGAWPSFHVLWVLLAAASLDGARPTVRVAAYAWAAAVGLSCLTTGMHAAQDVVAGVLVFWVVHFRDEVWRGILYVSEKLANGWREWKFGPIRVINHGAFGALGALAGFFVVSSILGAAQGWQMWTVGLASIVTAALWAQIIEGESVSLRPFGYYGAVVGVVIGGGALAVLGTSPLHAWAAFAVGAPLIQAFGRCRCLIQGCCHGQPCSPEAGIVVVHERSRVVKLSGLGGQPVYPTQTYSILANVATALIMFRLWSLDIPSSGLVGAYLVLAGAARFVEESFRGEPQTPRVAGLPIYQWNAVASFAAGLGFLAWPSAPMGSAAGLTLSGAASAAALAVVVGVLMGVDLPASRARFGRLTK